MRFIELQPNKKIYFASDFHLGYPDFKTSLIREKKVISWLDTIKTDAQVIFLVGDIFDFWFEYKNVVPKGYVRLLGKLAELSDSGIEIVIFAGNHDIWMFDYFAKEMGLTVYRNAQEYSVSSYNSQLKFKTLQTFYIVHGDGLGPGDYSYKYLKKVFESKLAQWTFSWLHPHTGISLATWWSGSRKDEKRIKKELQFRGEGEWLWHFAKQQEALKHHDYYIFGHRHLLLDLPVGENSRYINLGQWAYDDENSNHFAVYNCNNLKVQKFL